MKSKPLKIFTILTTVLGSTATLVTPLSQANAELIIPRDITYWSFQDMLDIEADFDSRASERCGEDRQCVRDYLFEEMQAPDQDAKYGFVEYMKNNHFTITAINPTAETIRLYYRDQDGMDWYMGHDRYYNLEELYLAWVEESVPDPRMEPRWVNGRLVTDYAIDVRNGVTTPGVHYVYSGTSAEYGVGWLTPNIEHEFSVSGSQLASDPRHWMHFLVLGDYGGDMLGMSDYSTCFNADYREGMECRVMYASDGMVNYLPFWPDSTPNSNTTDAADDVPDSNTASVADDTVTPVVTAQTITLTPPVSTSVIRALTDSVNREKSESSTALSSSFADTSVAAATSEPSDDHVELPLASGPTNCAEAKFQFPWWLVAFLIGGDALALWWFLPSRSKKR